MPSTPVYSFPYPALTDAPNGATQIQALADAVEDQLQVTDASVTALNALFATGVTLSNSQATAATTTSLTYTETLTGGAACSVIFVAPASGKVIVHNSGTARNSTTARSTISWIIRNGGTVGAGTTFLDGGDNFAVSVVGAEEMMVGRAVLVTGLSSGSTYNIRQQFKNSSASTGTFDRKHLIVQPIWV